MEKTFIMVKPDGVQRNLIGEIISRFEKKGYKLIAAKLMQVPVALAKEHYAEHKERPFLVNWLTLLHVHQFLPWFGKEKILLKFLVQ